MNNYNLLYGNQTESEVESEEENPHSDYDDEEPNLNKVSYTTKDYNILISSINRNWLESNSSTFSFPVKFNTSESSLEYKKVYSDQIEKRNVTITNTLYAGSESLSIPVNIKNIESLHIDKLILPNRNNYLGNGGFNETINFNVVLVHIEEFNNTNYGSNDGLNKCFCVMEGGSSFDSSLNYLEFDNLTEKGKEFMPCPLNNINCLTFKFTDDQGNLLKYKNEYLSINKIDVSGNYLKITTNEYFSRLNYKEGDIVCFKSVSGLETYLNLCNYLNQKKGHKIYFEADYTPKKNLLSIEDLENVFYVAKPGDYLLNKAQSYTKESITYPSSDTDFTGSIINKNLQLLIKLKIVSREMNFSFFNPQII